MKKHSIGLMASDIDGTLTALKQIPMKNINAIRDFQTAGGRFTVATGRIPALLKEITSQVRLNAPAICLNGACLYDTERDDILEFHGLEDCAKSICFDLAKRYPKAGLMIASLERYYVLRQGDYVDKSLAQIMKIRHMSGEYVDATWEKVDPQWSKCIFLISGKDMNEMVCREKEELQKYGLKLVKTSPYFLELIDGTYSKGDALIKLADICEVPLSMVAAIGDEHNDLELLHAAGWRAAVTGAPKELTDMANIITCSCQEGAVSEALEAYRKFLKGKHCKSKEP